MASVCLFNPQTWDYTVSLQSTGPSDKLEPRIGWSNETSSLGMSSIRNLLGATTSPLSLADRGVLALDHPANWTRARADVRWGLNTTNFVWNAVISRFGATGDFGNNCQRMSGAGSLGVSQTAVSHRVHMALFDDVLAATGDLSMAIQAVFTTLAQAAYYDVLPQFDTAAEATTVSLIRVFIPRSRGGFTGIMALVGAHVVILAVVTALFLWLVEASFPGDAWAAVGQLVSQEMVPLWDQAANMRDGEVKKWAGRDGWGKTKVGLVRRKDRWEIGANED